MTAKRYTYATTLSWGGDTPTAELEVECTFAVEWGEPAQLSGPPERCHDGSPSYVEDIKIISVDGKPWPVDLSYGYQTEAQDHDMLVDKLVFDHEEYMIEAVLEKETAAS